MLYFDIPARQYTLAQVRAAAKYYARRIRRDAYLCKTTRTNRGTARVEVSMAYRNDSGDPDKMSYRVKWFDGGTLKECENGITIDQAARAMADFALLSDMGYTMDEILYPAAGQQAAHIKRQQIKKIFAKKINNEKITNFALWKEKNYYLTRFYFPEP